jgi:hypothetical protein
VDQLGETVPTMHAIVAGLDHRGLGHGQRCGGSGEHVASTIVLLPEHQPIT